MSAVVILLVVKFSRFLVKDKSENTFIKYVVAEGINTHSTTKLVNFSQLTTPFRGLVLREYKKRLPLDSERRDYKYLFY